MKVYTFAVSIPAIDKEPVLVVKFRGKEILYCLIGFGIGVGFCLLCKLCKKLLFSRTPLTDAIAAAVRTEELKEVREHDETRTQFITPQFKQYNTIQQQQQQRKDVIVNEEFKEEEQQHNHHHQSNDDETFFLNNEQIIRNVFNDENRQKQLRRRYKRFSQRNHDRRHINLNFSHQHNLNDIDRLIQLQNDLDQLKSGIWHRSAIFTEVDSGIETKPSSMQNSMKKSNSTDTLQLEDGQVVDQALEQIGRLKTDMDNLCQDIQHLSSSPSMPLSESDQLKTDLNRKKISPNSPNKSTNLNKTNPNKLALEKLRLKNNMKNIVDELNLDRTELDKAIDSAVRQTYEDKYGSEFSAIINHNEKKFRNNSIDDEEESMINVGDEFDWELSSIDSTSAGPGASANNSVQRFKRNSTVHSLLDKKHLIRTRSCGKDLMKDKTIPINRQHSANNLNLL
ncbi:hypothetical protein SNEBB_002356 [Seison nebaliae]|nr:hypothetical protein SNEBB_002356 [Seison nebaliae]